MNKKILVSSIEGIKRTAQIMENIIKGEEDLELMAYEYFNQLQGELRILRNQAKRIEREYLIHKLLHYAEELAKDEIDIEFYKELTEVTIEQIERHDEA